MPDSLGRHVQENAGPQGVIRSTASAEWARARSKQDMEPTKGVERTDGDTRTSILVVDDEVTVRRSLERLLRESGHEVHSCGSAQEAVAQLMETGFDLVITDLKMAGTDGLSVLRTAKELDPSCEVIVVSGLAPALSAAEARTLGAYDCLGKPFDMGHVSTVVDNAADKRRLARVDSLTGLYNRRAFCEQLDAEIGRSERRLRPMSVLMVGLDHGKGSGATSGEGVRDPLLKEVARLVKKAVRGCDVVARYRGDELAVILVETSKADAIGTAERIRLLVEKSGLRHHDGSCHPPLTVSVGAASYPTDACQGTRLVMKADEALSRANSLGGNLVRSAELALTHDCHKNQLYVICKRCIDILLSLLCLIITAPLFPLIALLIRLDSSGPVIFAQGRVGSMKRSGGKRGEWEIGTFTFYKFRTMRHNAGQGPHRTTIRSLALGEPGSHGRNSQGQTRFKLTDDPRLTRVGKVLRGTSLDELPQLFNVLKGEMSMVGPRPVPLYEVAQYKEWQRERLATLPGITGLWQVKGRSRVPFDEMIRMDIEYIRNQSLWLDLKILLLTIPAVLSGEGAA
jgi:diguanylate cyclase (GGDEF)-like protein